MILKYECYIAEIEGQLLKMNFIFVSYHIGNCGAICEQVMIM